MKAYVRVHEFCMNCVRSPHTIEMYFTATKCEVNSGRTHKSGLVNIIICTHGQKKSTHAYRGEKREKSDSQLKIENGMLSVCLIPFKLFVSTVFYR